ncbi:MAG: zinc ribbon domain-containing protein [Bacteroidales bacterium]|nr:zinc ribbon domain-containing protein [Candidatus Latescibacterota bacterium]
MPIFEFICSKCEEQFEELVSSSDSKVKCPFCGSARTEKQFSSFSSSSSSGVHGGGCAPSGGG